MLFSLTAAYCFFCLFFFSFCFVFLRTRDARSFISHVSSCYSIFQSQHKLLFLPKMLWTKLGQTKIRPLTRSLYMRKESLPLRCCTKIVMKTFRTNTESFFLYLQAKRHNSGGGTSSNETGKFHCHACNIDCQTLQVSIPGTGCTLYICLSGQHHHIIIIYEIPVFCVRPRNGFALYRTCRYFLYSTVIMIQ